MLFRLFIAFCFCVFSAIPAHATHIVGGEVTYKCLGNQQYELTLTVYRDCYTGVPWFDDPVSLGIYRANWSLVQQVLIPLDSMTNDTLPIILTNPCLVAPPDVCVHRSVYKAIVTLPMIAGGYTIVYQRCCRNNLIRNIIDPLGTGASFTAQISEDALAACNSGSVFNSWPPVAICINEPIDFDHSASDPDGDSLVYRLCTPLDGADPDFPLPQPPNPGPYLPVVWNEPDYNLSNVLGGVPLTIDPTTGFLTGIPNMIGNYVVGICVDEYRDGSVISTSRRDFQYNVADCGKPFAAFFSPKALCDTLTFRFLNQSNSATFFRWYFDWDGDHTQTSVGYSPVHTFPDTGWYNIALIAEPSDPCSDTTFQKIHVTQTFAAADLDIQFPDCDENGLIVQANDLSVDPMFGIASWNWQLTGPGGPLGTSTLQNPQFTVEDPGDYKLRLVVLSGNGCPDTISLPFTAPIPPLSNLEDSLLICVGDSIFLFPGADTAYTYSWSPEASLSAANVPNPQAFPSLTTTYQVTVSGNGPCVFEKTVKVKVLNQGTISVTANPILLFPGESSQLEATFPGATDFNWTPAGTLSNAFIYNPVATPTDTTTYTVNIPLSSGCEVFGTITLFVLFPFCDEPFVFFPTGFSPNGDGENETLKLESKFATEVYWVIYNRWGEKIFEADSIDDAWDGTYHGKPQPAETYGYYLRIKCVDGQERIKKGNVTLLR